MGEPRFNTAGAVSPSAPVSELESKEPQRFPEIPEGRMCEECGSLRYHAAFCRHAPPLVRAGVRARFDLLDGAMRDAGVLDNPEVRRARMLLGEAVGSAASFYERKLRAGAGPGAPTRERESEPKRYSLYHESLQAWMDEEPDGAYVLYEEYARLAAASLPPIPETREPDEAVICVRCGLPYREHRPGGSRTNCWFTTAETAPLAGTSEPTTGGETDAEREEAEALAREIATARRFLEQHGHAVVDMRNRDASVVPIGVDFREGGDDQ